ncbi:general transcription factor IIE subunit 1 [Cydia splendana]|uniref:general transcription factor IIE subunit 1 n=1 Tax=Cydia splendana TaxID=1100963 RepID=UPI00300D4110
MTEERLVTEVPSSLKQLARLVVRGFYTIEDALIVDMLVRNPCMKEDDICELLKFERKMLRARIATLKNDKFIQVRLKMETGADGKAQKVNYYFINYKTFVNVVKYKLDLMRKRMETEERDATSRASFKCPSCGKTFTDLEADQLYDMMTQEFRCTFCSQVVEEDQSALPKKDSRLLLAKYNEQLEPLYQLLRAVEGIKLAPEILEPEPVDINTIRGLNTKQSLLRPGNEQWSGEATRSGGLAVEETRVDVTIGEASRAAPARKERPVWMVESTVSSGEQSEAAAAEAALEKAASSAAAAKASSKGADDIMSVLLQHEKQNTGTYMMEQSADSAGGEQRRSSQALEASSAAAAKTSSKGADDIMSVLLQHEKQNTGTYMMEQAADSAGGEQCRSSQGQQQGRRRHHVRAAAARETEHSCQMGEQCRSSQGQQQERRRHHVRAAAARETEHRYLYMMEQAADSAGGEQCRSSQGQQQGRRRHHVRAAAARETEHSKQQTALEASSAAAAKASSKGADDIMSVLLQHEKQNTDNSAANALKAEPDSSDDSDAESKDPFKLKTDVEAIPEMESSSSESEDGAPSVLVAGARVALPAVDDAAIARMTPQEKEAYIQLYQDYYSHILD